MVYEQGTDRPDRWTDGLVDQSVGARGSGVGMMLLEVVILELVLGNSGASNEGCARGVVVDAEEIVEWRFWRRDDFL